MGENQQEKSAGKIPEGLTPEEVKIWNEIQDIINSFVLNSSKNKIPVEKMSKEQKKDLLKKIEEMQQKKIDLGKELIKDGINPYEYYLWHKFIGSSVPEGENLKLDTEHTDDTKDRRIEKFMKAFYDEYKQ